MRAHQVVFDLKQEKTMLFKDRSHGKRCSTYTTSEAAVKRRGGVYAHTRIRTRQHAQNPRKGKS